MNTKTMRTQKVKTVAKASFSLLLLFILTSSHLAAQSGSIGDKKLQRLILSQAQKSKSQGVLRSKQMVLDWEKYAIEDKLANTWSSLSNLGEQIDLKLSKKSQAYLMKQFKSQKTSEWDSSFIHEMKQTSKKDTWYNMGKPVFTKNRKMAFIPYAFGDGELIVLFRKHKGKWERYAMIQLWGT